LHYNVETKAIELYKMKTGVLGLEQNVTVGQAANRHQAKGLQLVGFIHDNTSECKRTFFIGFRKQSTEHLLVMVTRTRQH
jgi:hypothetical protein